jgi:hypothetical protein
LFTYAEEYRLRSKLKVAIDANIFFQLQEAPAPLDEESQALLADWLQEDVELCLTKETRNEINRHPDAETRRRERAFASGFVELASTDEGFQKACDASRAFFPDRMSVSDESDVRQLAWSLSSGVQFFVTRDSGLLEKDEQFQAAFGIRVICPADLIIYQDQLMRETEYCPARLAGSQVGIVRIRSDERASLEDLFLAPQEETKAKFRRRLNIYLSDPHTYETDIVQSAEQPLALIVRGRQAERELEVPIFRLARGSLSPTLARYLALQSVLTSSRERRVLTRVTDPHLSDIVVDALQDTGFALVDEIWTKANLSTIGTSDELVPRLISLSSDITSSKQYFHQIIGALTVACAGGDTSTMLQVERSLWPAKLTDIDIPAFIVPIQPVWAMHLFDPGIANQDLFGGDPNLILSVENVYYRARHPKVLSAPARVLWYVSKGKGKYQGTMSVRACSYIDEVAIDKPKVLFSRLRRLGVYRWEDVFEIAKRDANQEIMAFRFSNTEVFDHPIHRDEMQEIWREETGKSLHLQCPVSMPAQTFFRLYKKGIGLT